MPTYGVATVVGIVMICYLVGLAIRVSPLDNKWIPVIVGVCGGILGVLGFYLGIPDFPAADIITAIAVGISSGLASTGADQIGKQFKE